MTVRPPLMLTGPPAVGKSVTGRELARARSRGAFVDVDDIRHLVVAGHAAPWDGKEGVRQQRLGVRNACSLARNFIAAGIDVVLADVLTPATVALYRQELPGCVVVHLVAPFAETLRRAATRPPSITEAEFRMLHCADAVEPPPSDHVIDVTALDLPRQVRAVEQVWQRLTVPRSPT